jgi:hypothetical protein
VASEEPVTSPDQHAQTPVKKARIAGVVTIVILLLLTIGNVTGVERAWILTIAGIIALLLISDVVQRRNGLR